MHSKSHKVCNLSVSYIILKHKYVANWSCSTYSTSTVQISIISTSSLPSPAASELGIAIQPTRWVKGEQRTRLNYVEELGAQVIFANQPPARPRNGSDATLVQGWVWQLWGKVNAWTSKSAIVFPFKHGPPKTGWSFFGSFCRCHISLDS